MKVSEIIEFIIRKIKYFKNLIFQTKRYFCKKRREYFIIDYDENLDQYTIYSIDGDDVKIVIKYEIPIYFKTYNSAKEYINKIC